MDAILNFLNEMRRSDWADDVQSMHRKYNGTTIQETELSYSKKIVLMYNAAVLALVNVPSEKYEIILKLIEEVVDCQECFEMPSDELLKSFIHDYEQSNHTNRRLKDDYDYLCFVRDCMKIQIYYLNLFKNKFPKFYSQEIETAEEKVKEKEIPSTKQNEPIKGVKGLAAYLNIGTTKAQDIINSNILQDMGVAYRVGKGWNFHPQKLEELLSNNPELLYKRNK